MLPRQGEMGENTPFPENKDKRSVNNLGTIQRVMTDIEVWRCSGLPCNMIATCVHFTLAINI